MDKIIPIFQKLRRKSSTECPEIEPPVPDMETEWVVLEKDRYIRQRLNSKIAHRNFQRIESIKEELIKMKSENEEFLFNAEFGFDQDPFHETPLFTPDDSLDGHRSARKAYSERFVSWGDETTKRVYQSPSEGSGRGLDRSYSMDELFRMSFQSSKAADKSPVTSPRSDSSIEDTFMDEKEVSFTSDYIEERIQFENCHFDLQERRRDRKYSAQTDL